MNIKDREPCNNSPPTKFTVFKKTNMYFIKFLLQGLSPILPLKTVFKTNFDLRQTYNSSNFGNRWWCYVSHMYVLCFKDESRVAVVGRKLCVVTCTTQKMKFSIGDFVSICDQIRSFLRIWSHLLKKSLMENFIFCAVLLVLIWRKK